MLMPPHHQNLHQAMNDRWSIASHVRCRREPKCGCPQRVRSGSLQAQESQPCGKAESGSLEPTREVLLSRAHQKLAGNSWVVMILRACTQNQHRGCLH